jgi:hypothetical protein
MSTLTNNTVADTYKDLIHAANGGLGVNSGSTIYLEDGNGDSIPIAIQGSDSNTGNRLILGGGKYTSEVTESLTLSASNIVTYASGGNGSVDIKGDTVSVAATGLSLTFGSLPEAGGGVLTTSPDTGHSTLLWHGSGGVDEKVLTQSYELLDDAGAATASDAAVTEVKLSDVNAVDVALPTGDNGQMKTILLTANTASVDVTIGTDVADWTSGALGGALVTGHIQLVKTSTGWVILTETTT